MINELAGFPTRSENAYFANNEQASIAVFTAVFCFVIDQRKLQQRAMWNSKKPIKFAHL